MLIRWKNSLGFDNSRSNENGYVMPLRRHFRVLLKHECSIDLNIEKKLFSFYNQRSSFSIEFRYKPIYPFVANANRLILNKSNSSIKKCLTYMYNNITEAKCTGFQFDIRENRTGKRAIIWKSTKALAKTSGCSVPQGCILRKLTADLKKP